MEYPLIYYHSCIINTVIVLILVLMEYPLTNYVT